MNNINIVNGGFVKNNNLVVGVTGGTYNSNTEELEFIGTQPENNFNINISGLTNTFTADYLTAKTINVSEILSFGIGYVGFDPTLAVDGDMWYRSDLNEIRVKLNNTTLTLSTTAPI